MVKGQVISAISRDKKSVRVAQVHSESDIHVISKVLLTSLFSSDLQ